MVDTVTDLNTAVILFGAHKDQDTDEIHNQVQSPLFNNLPNLKVSMWKNLTNFVSS